MNAGPDAAVLRVTILGCGPSAGVPSLGGPDGRGYWGACDPNEPRNRRRRGSILVERKASDAAWSAETTTRILVDTSPDLRAQLLDAGVDSLDAVLFTHDHADQCHGIDDLRPLTYRRTAILPAYYEPATAPALMRRFGYIFQTPPGGLYPPILEARAELKPGARIVVTGPGGPVTVATLAQNHGPVDSLGFRFGPIAYSNDVVDMPEATFTALADLETWIVDATRRRPHLTHAHLDKTLGWIARLGPARAVLTNLNGDMDYRTIAAETPAHVEPAYDGMQIEARVPAAAFV